MESKIELFKLILERTELCRIAFNANAQLRYTTEKRLKGKCTRDKLNIKIINAKKAKEAVKAFTKANIKRRKQLARELNTRQYKSSSNTIIGARVANKYYAIKEMKELVDEYTIEQILLGGNNE